MSNAKKAEIARKNAENTALQRAAAALKKEQQQVAEEKKLEAKLEEEREVFSKEYMKAERKRITIRLYKLCVKSITRDKVRHYVQKLRLKIWRKKIAKINNLAKSPERQKIILVEFSSIQDLSKTFYFVFENEVKGMPSLCLSVYENYIFSKILTTCKTFDPQSYQCIFATAKFKLSTLENILETHFSNFDETKVIKCISMSNNHDYEILVKKFASKFYKGVSSILHECLEHTFEKYAKIHNIDITEVSNYAPQTISAFYYEKVAEKSYHIYNHNHNHNDAEYANDDEYDRSINFTTGIRYYNGCQQCITKNLYMFSFHNGFDPNSKMHSLVYNKMHYTVLNMDDLFKQLLKDGLIYEKPVCHNCCKKNEVDKELSMVMLKLSGLMYIGDPNYAVKYPMDLNDYFHDHDADDGAEADALPYDDIDDGIKECITITLPKESSQSNENINIIQLIKSVSWKKQYCPIKELMVSKKISQYTARVPIFSQFILWNPSSDVTIAFRNMQITFGLCQSMLSCRLPDLVFRYIFSFIVIPDMDTNLDRHKDFNLACLDNSKLIEEFVHNVNFRTCC